VQLDDIDIVRRDAGRFIDLIGSRLRQVEPTTRIISRVSNVLGRSVVMACARMRTLTFRLWRAAKALETSTAAAAPQVGGHAIERVITPSQMTGACITSPSVISLRNSASGFRAAWRLALARILAKVDILMPYFFKCCLPAPPK
jgi:hypothetical protein